MKIPKRLTLEEIQEFARDIYRRLQEPLADLKGRRLTGAGGAVTASDYITKQDMDDAIGEIRQELGIPERRKTALEPDKIGDFLITGNYKFRSDTASIGTLDHAITGARTWTFPDSSDIIVLLTATQTLTRKSIGDPTDPTKALTFTLSGATAARTMTVISAHTDNRSLTLPNDTGTLDYSTATLTADQLLIGAGTSKVAPLGSLGTTTTLLHGNAGGAPTFAAVGLTTDVTGVLPVANGGTNANTAGGARSSLDAAEAITPGGSGPGTYTLITSITVTAEGTISAISGS